MSDMNTSIIQELQKVIPWRDKLTEEEQSYNRAAVIAALKAHKCECLVALRLLEREGVDISDIPLPQLPDDHEDYNLICDYAESLNNMYIIILGKFGCEIRTADESTGIWCNEESAEEMEEIRERIEDAFGDFSEECCHFIEPLQEFVTEIVAVDYLEVTVVTNVRYNQAIAYFDENPESEYKRSFYSALRNVEEHIPFGGYLGGYMANETGGSWWSCYMKYDCPEDGYGSSSYGVTGLDIDFTGQIILLLKLDGILKQIGIA